MQMNLAGLSLGWAFCGYFAVVILTAALLHQLRHLPRFFSLVSLPGTMGHELLHFLVGTLTLAKPVKVSLLPKFHRDGSATLGYVMFSNIRWYNALWVGFAPLLALPAAFWVVYYRAAQIPPVTAVELAWAYLAASLAYSCLPSKADVDIVLSKPLGLAIYIGVIAALAWLAFAR
ncbi:MAG TPA: hypothetical protein VHB46_13680 [Burkholderiales bacterium]|nr:hypothetical protein [Burkholderiales bacterium]